MRKLMLIMGLGAALAGCNKGPSTEESARQTGDVRLENATTDEVMKQAAAAQGKNKTEPGEWESTLQFVSVDMPGAPEMLRKQVEAQVKKPPETRKECKKADDAQSVDLTKLGAVTKDCVFPKYILAGGKIDANMECKGPFGPVKILMNGTQSSTAFDITITQSQTMPGTTGESKMTMRATGKRLGACKA